MNRGEAATIRTRAPGAPVVSQFRRERAHRHLCRVSPLAVLAVSGLSTSYYSIIFLCLFTVFEFHDANALNVLKEEDEDGGIAGNYYYYCY